MFQKITIAAAMILTLAGSMASAHGSRVGSNFRAIPQCGHPVTKRSVGSEVHYWDVVEPKGACDKLGRLEGATVLDCRNAAISMGYDCYQVTTWLYGFDRAPEQPVPVCYACIY